jgi:hypothetical protein
MSRNTAFAAEHEPFRDHPHLQLQDSNTGGPVQFLNPTRGQFHHTKLVPSKETSNWPASNSSVDEEELQDEIPASQVSFLWRSRDNRKGRHTIGIKKLEDGEEGQYLVPPPTTEWKQIAKGILRMFTHFPYWDISWWVAMCKSIPYHVPEHFRICTIKDGASEIWADN